ncbi:MAG: winged helix-turn-helix transcriptional regulator [Lachnospiraceae bacterium]|nr:winged helix-turn-helix transcriptional regulator [Lachnospiraceae bacterium]
MDEKLHRVDLFDFYGELLSEHQREIYEAYACEDLSLAEIAETVGISRQGVSDQIRRCTHMMEGYEEKLGLIRRFTVIREYCDRINEITEDEDIRRITALMKEEL